MEQTEIIMIIILIVAIVAGGLIMMDDSCPDSGIRITKSCKCGEEECPVGNTCNDTAEGKKCIHPTDDPNMRTQMGIPSVSQESQQESGSEALCEDIDCGNGRCSQGKCICNPGYTGSHCLMSTMDWTRISQDDGGSKVTEINGQKYCADNYYSDLTVEGGNCELCPSSSLSGDNLRSKAPNNGKWADCRCENINGLNMSYVNKDTKECVTCPQEEGSSLENPSKIVPLDIRPLGDETDCRCNNDAGWYENSEGGCMQCPPNSTMNTLTKECDCITGYDKDDNGNCNISEEFRRYINKCGIYEFELESGNKKLVDGLPVLSGLISPDFDDNTSELLFDDTTNHGVAATWFKHHANNSQFSFTESGTCKYKGESGQLSTCGEPGGEGQHFDDNCNKCKDGKTLVWDAVNGFNCKDNVCDASQGSSAVDNIQKCFVDENIIPSSDRNFIEQNGLAGNGICSSSDPNNSLGGNMCSTNLLNISGDDGQGNAMALPGSDNLRLSNWENLSDISKPQYSANRYELEENTDKIVCRINPEIQGVDHEGNDVKRCLEKNNICERFNVDETGQFRENICKNNSKCVNINVPPYFDCVDPFKQEPATSVTTDPDTEYYKDGTYNKCPANFIDENSNIVSLTPEQARQRAANGEPVIRNYGKLCHLTSAINNSPSGKGVCGWGYMQENDNGSKRLKKHDDFIGGIEMTPQGPMETHYMRDGDHSIFNLPITADEYQSYSWNNYQCDCTNANKKGKFHRHYDVPSLDTNTFCFGPTNDSDIGVAMDTDNTGDAPVHMTWQKIFQPRFDFRGNRLSTQDNNDIENTLITQRDDSNRDIFPNSINNLSYYLECGTKEFTNTADSTDGYNTGHFFHFDQAFTDSGDQGDAIGSPLCIPCSDSGQDQLRGHNQIKIKKWLGWNPDNTGLDDESHDSLENYTQFLQQHIEQTGSNEFLSSIASMDLDQPINTQHQNRVCKPAYPNYYGTLTKGDTESESVGGEKARGNQNKDKKPVLNGDILRKKDNIDALNCPPENSLQWAPVNFWLRSTQNCNLRNSEGLIDDRYLNINSIGTGGSGNARRTLVHGQNLDWGSGNQNDDEARSSFNTFQTAANNIGCSNVYSFKGEELKRVSDVNGIMNESDYIGATGNANYHCHWSNVYP